MLIDEAVTVPVSSDGPSSFATEVEPAALSTPTTVSGTPLTVTV